MTELLAPPLPEDTVVRGGSRDLGLDVVSVAIDSRTGARGVYERAGMSVTWPFTRMSLPL